ncbi:MAG: hypothetical protein C4589_02980 [Peptococcaceae bacterium]|nr:MAG: hypothetical protein C4589_02980 [Peptococcaceae bacterium]
MPAKDMARYMREWRKSKKKGVNAKKESTVPVPLVPIRVNGEIELVPVPVTFISRYAAIVYALPQACGADPKGNRLVARFTDGHYTTWDGRIIAYLRSHADWGITLSDK